MVLEHNNYNFEPFPGKDYVSGQATQAAEALYQDAYDFPRSRGQSSFQTASNLDPPERNRNYPVNDQQETGDDLRPPGLSDRVVAHQQEVMAAQVLSQLSPAEVASIPPAWLSCFNSNQLHSMTAEQIQALTPAQLHSVYWNLTETQRGHMSANQHDRFMPPLPAERFNFDHRLQYPDPNRD